ncbi:TRAP transporter large permease [Arenibaculum pallidiluteum]|uniref:TRAP transporter large permease n=1 Tax=Arenibaculum pallidiluteum TaxID=2812559 RepID=UPI001A975695|nr:TRAP transporter large permease [Arenibaculum pallidiluteum]
MEPWSIAALGFAALLVLIAIGWPIGISMIITGGVGTIVALGWRAAFSTVGQTVSMTPVSYELSVVPMFILMGELIVRSGEAGRLYGSCYRFLGHLRGGLAMATIAACAGFAALSGSSIATAAAMGRVAMPEMRRYRYADDLASGAIAAGGTLGILIPPSVLMVLYGIQTGTDIGQLFIAGIVPGVLGAVLYIVTIAIVCALRPEAGPRGERSSWAERRSALREIYKTLILFLVVIGGIYGGIFTATEAAGIGAFGALVIALVNRSLSVRTLVEAVTETAKVTANLFFVLIGAIVFSNFLNVTGLTNVLSGLVTGWGLPGIGVIALITVIYVVLGTFMEELSMVLLTVPVFFPIVTSFGYDPVWFGIYVVFITQLGMISPPVGINLFVIKGLFRDIPGRTIFRGVMPFIAMDMVRLAILIAFPATALFLPRLAAP